MQSVSKKLLIVILLAFLTSLILCWPLWLNERSIPLVPLLDNFVFTGWSVWVLLGFWASLFLMAIIDIGDKRFTLPLIILLAVLFGLQDQLRWQPWFYQFVLMLLAYTFFLYQKVSEKELFSIFQILLVGIYLWSGIHKLNVPFVENTLQNLIGLDIGILGWGVPITEIILALCLIFKKARRLGVVGLIFMHVTIIGLVIFGGLNHNEVIIPWNLSMIIFVALLFSTENDKTKNSITFPKALAFGIFIIFPAFNMIGLTDSYPSFSLYSGKTDKAYLYVTEDFKRNYFSKSVQEEFDKENKIYFQKWFFTELNVPVYPEERVFKGILNSLCRDIKHELDLILEIHTLPNLFSAEWNRKSSSCLDL